jgi:soluble lytic murein transglycosylase
MFMRYAAASQTPGSQAKGEYWAGRAAETAGDRPGAQAHYANAARNVDQFYGQLATERLGKTIVAPADPPAVPVPAEARTAFRQSEIVRAARLLGQQRRWQDQTQFVRTIAQTAKTDQDHVLAGELAREMSRPDLGVIVSRAARTSGTRDPIRIGFPTMPVPPVMESHWTMIHAISRQESQFDREALSAANAKGLMQLMNPTAKEQAGKIGLPWDPARLTADPGYNVMLGSSFFDRLLTYYNGSYVLAVASYNAGPGNVNKFIRANGDPRMPGIDMIDWIEAIPFTETRSYVQKVLENAVVYDLFNPERARTPDKDRLSYYLGKKSAG